MDDEWTWPKRDYDALNSSIFFTIVAAYWIRMALPVNLCRNAFGISLPLEAEYQNVMLPGACIE
jgi:hypothetical protein